MHFRYKNNNVMMEYTFDNSTWRSHIYFVCRTWQLHIVNTTMMIKIAHMLVKKDDDDDEQQQREDKPEEDGDPWGNARPCKGRAKSKAKAKAKAKSKAKGQGKVLQEKGQQKGNGKAKGIGGKVPAKSNPLHLEHSKIWHQVFLKCPKQGWSIGDAKAEASKSARVHVQWLFG